LEEEWGADVCEIFNRLVTIQVMKYSTDSFSQRFPESIRRIYERENKRILSWVRDRERTGFRISNDVFLKDLKCLTTEMIPCGARVIETASGVPRAIFYSGGFTQFCEAVRLLISVGGHKPFFETHVHLPTLFEFTQQGADECYLRIVDLFESFPDVKGLIGCSWYFDPAIKYVSPRLAYLRDSPIKRGAKFFRIGTSEGAVRDALAKSETRRRLYAERRYTPTSYLFIWPRAQMIQWARSARAYGSQREK
jgi:hypothetical protein